MRHKEDFLIAFSPVMAEASATAYKGAPSDVQQRIRRVVDVWKERHVFEEPIQAAIETRIEGKIPGDAYIPRPGADIFPQNSTRPGALPSLGLVERYSATLHRCLRN